MLGIPRRFSHFVYGVIQSGLTCAIAAGIASFPFIADGDLRDPLVAIVVCRLDHNAAGCALRSTGHSQPNVHVDAGRLNLADRGLNPAQKCLRWVKRGLRGNVRFWRKAAVRKIPLRGADRTGEGSHRWLPDGRCRRIT